jgi:hypothetical protein
MTRVFGLGVAAAMAVSTVTTVRADDATAQQKFEAAKAAFAQRKDLAKNEQAIVLADEAAKLAQDKLLKYDALILKSRALYFRGGKQTKKADKMATYEAGYNTASEAARVDNSYAEAYYYFAINLGKWGLAKGIDTSILDRANENEKALETAMKLKTRAGAAGETIDGYGPYRTLSKMHLELSKIPFVKWNKNDAIKYGDLAYSGAAWLPLNGVYLAEALFKKGGDEREARAKQVLNEVLNLGPKLNPERAPENEEELKDARELLEENS